MFSYGKVYTQLNLRQLSKLNLGFPNSRPLTFLAKIYLHLFGFPEIAGHLRFNQVLPLVSNPGSVLDVGCGNGIYLQELSSRFNSTGFGIDGVKERIDTAKQISKFLKYDNNFKVINLEQAKFDKNKYDLAICIEVLEHIKNDDHLLKQIHNSLKPKGQFIATIPQYGTALPHDHDDDDAEPFEHVRSGYKLKELQAQLKKAGFKKVEIKPYFFFVSRNLVKIQHWLYKNNLSFLNILTAPFLIALSHLGNVLKINSRGFVINASK